MEAESDWFGDVLKVALGIFLGGVLLWAAYEYRERYVAQQVLAELEATTQRASAQYDAAAAARRRLQVERDRELREQREASAEREVAERRKESAWRQFYQPSPECVAAASVQCGNEHIRARREFEQQYRGN